ncbi:hypothetical protein ACYSNW_08520 [Enterococcus sp. LJL99]
MRKKTFFIGIIASVLLFTLIGCTNKIKTQDVEHQKLLWRETREKPFGRFDYPQLTEQEALDLMKTKFNLKVSNFAEKTEELLKKELITLDLNEEAKEYSLYATGDELKLVGYYPMDLERKPVVTASIVSEYKFDKENKEVRLTFQNITISKTNEAFSFPEINGESLIKEVAKIVDIPEQTQKQMLTNFEKDYKKVEERPVNSNIVLFGNKDEAKSKKGVFQTIYVKFDHNREMSELNAVVSDYTE